VRGALPGREDGDGGEVDALLILSFIAWSGVGGGVLEEDARRRSPAWRGGGLEEEEESRGFWTFG
jgi:hypothetical protein